MKLLGYQAYKIPTAPASGNNPPTGCIFYWHSLDEADNLVINYRLPDGTDKVLSTGGTGGGLTVTEVTSNTTVENGKLYIANSASMINFTLPTTFAQGFTFGVLAKGTGGWAVCSGASSQIIKTLDDESLTASAVDERLQLETTAGGYCEYMATTADTVLNITVDNSSLVFPDAPKGYYSGDASLANVIISLEFGIEALSTLSTTLTQGKYSGGTYNSIDKGYYAGGETGSANNTAVIDALVFATESNGALSATLTYARRFSSSFNSADKGYICGGNGNSGSALLNDIESLTFTNDTVSDISATLSIVSGMAVGFNSSAKGYRAGGNTGDTSVWVNSIDAFTYSNETCEAISATLSTAKVLTAGANSNLKGYVFGGTNSGGVIGTIDALTFSSEVCTTLSSTLTTARSHSSATNSLSKAYVCAGYVTSGLDTVEALVFDTETTSVLLAELSNPSWLTCGYQSGGIL